MEYKQKEFRKKIKDIFEDSIEGSHSGTAFKTHFDLLKVEKHWLGYNLALFDMGVIDMKEYADNIDFISQYYNIYIEKKDKGVA